jgi:hypothetical protein
MKLVIGLEYVFYDTTLTRHLISCSFITHFREAVSMGTLLPTLLLKACLLMVALVMRGIVAEEAELTPFVSISVKSF